MKDDITHGKWYSSAIPDGSERECLTDDPGHPDATKSGYE